MHKYYRNLFKNWLSKHCDSTYLWGKSLSIKPLCDAKYYTPPSGNHKNDTPTLQLKNENGIVILSDSPNADKGGIKNRSTESYGDMPPSVSQDKIYETFYMNDYNKNIADLASLALPETWEINDDNPNKMLKLYLSMTFSRLLEEDKVIYTKRYCIFNTGLFTRQYEAIYFIAKKSSSSSEKEWTFLRFDTEYGLDQIEIDRLPERANYFSDPALLIFDYTYPVRIQYTHILEDLKNRKRLPKFLDDMSYDQRLKYFIGAVDISIKKVMANYKLAVPQYYKNQIQLLIPIYIENDDIPDLALAVTKKDGYYQGHTCLTLGMAYNNARLIAKPESNWLSVDAMPQNDDDDE